MQLDWEPQAGESLPTWAQDRRTVLRGASLSARIDRARWAALKVLWGVAAVALGLIALAVAVWRDA